MLMGFRVLPIVPIVQAKTALPWFGHAPIVLQLQRIWEGVAGFRPITDPLRNASEKRSLLVVFDCGYSNTETNEDDASKAVQGLAHGGSLEESS